MFYRLANQHNNRSQIFVILDAGRAPNGVQRYVAILQPGSYHDDPEGKLYRIEEPVVSGMDATMLLRCTHVMLRQKPHVPKEASDLAKRMREESTPKDETAA